ncbi:MAG: Bug family tripartite tricarboxylate transporter substrate binding protein [Burkholderiales bacterium]
MLRLIGDRLTKTLGQSFVIQNMPGGAGTIAAQTAARSAPDGYTFYLGGLGFIATDRYTMKSLPYDPDKDFVLVAKLYDTGAFSIAVNPAVPVRTIAELIAHARANPGKLSYGSETVGAPAIAGQWFMKVANIEMVAVPYKVGTQLIQDAIGGQTQAAVTSIPLMETAHRSGKLRIIGVTTPRRLESLPDIPAVGETLPGFRVGGLGILAAPAGTPVEAMQRTNREIDSLMKDKEYRERLVGFGFSVSDAGTPQSIADFVRAERENWGQIMKGLNIQPQ